MSFFFPSRQGGSSRSPLPGLSAPRMALKSRFLRSTRSTSDIFTSFSASTPSPSTLSPSSPYASSPSTSSSNSSPSSSSPNGSLYSSQNAIPEFSGNADQSETRSPIQRSPCIEGRISYGLPPSYETATSEGSRHHSMIVSNSSDDLASYTPARNLRDAGTRRSDTAPPPTTPRPPLPTPPIRSPTMRVIAETGEAHSVWDGGPPLSLDVSMDVPSNRRPSSIRRERLLLPPAGARAPYVTPRRERDGPYEHAFFFLKSIACSTNQGIGRA
ncbi:hypothetical protein K438DRAFT_681919 [Mycena galopus ATCC 62051]|nr:hypothetical protein K438DRAFT_681919 [Mycena galopus ATCC 62051]